MIRYEPMGLTWRPSSVPGLAQRLYDVLRGWEETPYVPGQRCKRVGVDCVRFLAGVLDELYGRAVVTEAPELPQDISMHNRRGAMKGLRAFLRNYPAHERVRDTAVEPGDIIVTGPPQGGPGHAIIVGPLENTLWQASGRHVHYTGLYQARDFQRVFAVYRLLDRDTWV